MRKNRAQKGAFGKSRRRKGWVQSTGLEALKRHQGNAKLQQALTGKTNPKTASMIRRLAGTITGA